MTAGSFVVAAAGDVDVVLVAVGVPSRREDELDPARTAEVTTAGFTWPAVALSAVGARMKDQGHGRIVVLSSTDDRTKIEAAAEAGAVGFVDKADGLALLPDQVELALAS